MTNDSSSAQELRFEVDAGLLFQLGERLVARPSVALAELVKNAYDADATHVNILLEGVSKGNGVIIIEDDGSGMTFEAVRDHWMRIATDDKIRNPISPRFGRPKTGAKGIGRFAARRLADSLSLSSVAGRDDGTKERVFVKFDWKTDFRPGQTLTSIPVAYERQVVGDQTPTGVTLLLEGVRDIWSEDDVWEVRRDLLSLTNPFPTDTIYQPTERHGFQPDPGFSVTLEVPEFPEQQGELREYIFQAAWGILEGKIDGKGKAHYHLKIRETGESVEYTEDEMLFPNLLGAEFRIYYFVYSARHFKGFRFGAQDAIGYGREHGGVRIYLDGFRVYGYGERGDDWLRLNELRAERVRRPQDLTHSLGLEADELDGKPFLRLPGNNQLFGAVFLSQSHHVDRQKGAEGIELTVSRERLVENKAFYQLHLFLRTGIYWLTLQYARVRAAELLKPVEEVVEPIASEIETALQSIERVAGAAESLSDQQRAQVTRAVREVREAVKHHDEYDDRRISEISMLRVLASIGTMVSLLNHQLRAILSDLSGAAAVFETYSGKVDARIRESYDNNVRKLWRWHRYVEQQVKQLGFLLGQDARSERRTYSLRIIIDQVAEALEAYREEFGIKFDNQVPANVISPPMHLAEIHAILINVFTNALKAVRQQPKREIQARAGWRDSKIYIQMLDTGRGLDIDPPELAFEPFRTTSAPDPFFGTGTGLGLYVVRSLLSDYNGDAHFIEAPSPWRTCIEIILPKE